MNETTYTADKIIVDRYDPRYSTLDDLCYKAKSLFNASLYDHKQVYKNTKKHHNWMEQATRFAAENQINYRALPARMAKEILKNVDEAYASFFAKIRNGDTTARPPHYRDSKGRYTATIPKQCISKKVTARPDGLYEFTITPKNEQTRFTVACRYSNVCMFKVIPWHETYVIQPIYKTKDVKPTVKPDNHRYAAIDLGLDNLMAITFNTGARPILVSGKPVKAINQWYNKQTAKIKSRLDTTDEGLDAPWYFSHEYHRICRERSNRLEWELNNIAARTAELIAEQDINRVIIGKNKDQKRNINLGKRTNQNFVTIPYDKLVDALERHLLEHGIVLIRTEESYTSKASFLDKDRIGVFGKLDNLIYSGKRVKRGLYKSKNGVLINADVNGSMNIMRKVVPDKYVYLNGIEAVAVRPLRASLLRNGQFQIR